MAFREISREDISFRGQTMTKVTEEKDIGKIDRAKSLIKGIGAALISLPTTILSIGATGIVCKDTIKDSFNEVKSGKTTKVKYLAKAQPSRKEGYDPTDSDNMNAYADAYPHKVLTANGHQYILNAADSAIILIPNGDRTKTCEIKFWDLSSGDDLVDAGRLEKTVRAYLVAYDKIEKQAQEIGTKLGSAVSFTHIAIDFDKKMIRGFNSPAPESSMGLWSGTRITLDEETWKTMANFFDSNKTKGQQSLKGEPVHPKPKNPDGHHPSTSSAVPPFQSNFASRPNSHSGSGSRVIEEVNDDEEEIRVVRSPSNVNSISNANSNLIVDDD